MNNSTTISRYFGTVSQLIEKISVTQSEAIENAASLILASYKKSGNFFVFGSGHSHIIAEEIYTRAGGYAPVNSILCPELMLHQMPNKSTCLERLSGYADKILYLYKFKKNDVLLIASNSGRNNVPVEMCIEAQKRGGKVIALTSLQHSSAVPSRHETGKRLFELADVVIDNGGKIGDAAFYLAGLDTPMGATSTISSSAIAHAIMIVVAEKLVEAGFKPPIFSSSNLDGADKRNEILFETYC